VTLGRQPPVRHQPDSVRTASDLRGTHHKSEREAIGRPVVSDRANHPDSIAGRRLRRAILPLVCCSCLPAGLIPRIRLIRDRTSTASDSGPR
jgi:hypothetical protein